jgi:hypothetical protein
MVKIPAAGMPDEIILGSWYSDLIEATACHLETGPAPDLHGAGVLRRNESHMAEPWRGPWWDIILRGVDHRPDIDYAVLPAPDLAEAWTWLAGWWMADYLQRHPVVALREAMSSIANMQQSSTWQWNTEIVAWELMHDRLDESAGCWWGETRNLPKIQAKLKLLHGLVVGWWVEGDEDVGWEPVFIDAEAWEIRRRDKWSQS